MSLSHKNSQRLWSDTVFLTQPLRDRRLRCWQSLQIHGHCALLGVLLRDKPLQRWVLLSPFKNMCLHVLNPGWPNPKQNAD